MRFLVIDPRLRKTHIVDVDDIADAMQRAGLKQGETDHGTIGPGLALAVAEYGLFQPPERQAYFAIGSRLYAGNAVVYGFDQEGHTRSIRLGDAQLRVRWFPNIADIERAIADGEVERPEIAINGRSIWQWPQGRPDFKPVAQALAEHPGDVVIDGDTVIRKL